MAGFLKDDEYDEEDEDEEVEVVGEPEVDGRGPLEEDTNFP